MSAVMEYALAAYRQAGADLLRLMPFEQLTSHPDPDALRVELAARVVLGPRFTEIEVERFGGGQEEPQYLLDREQLVIDLGTAIMAAAQAGDRVACAAVMLTEREHPNPKHADLRVSWDFCRYWLMNHAEAGWLIFAPARWDEAGPQT